MSPNCSNFLTRSAAAGPESPSSAPMSDQLMRPFLAKRPRTFASMASTRSNLRFESMDKHHPTIPSKIKPSANENSVAAHFSTNIVTLREAHAAPDDAPFAVEHDHRRDDVDV